MFTVTLSLIVPFEGYLAYCSSRLVLYCRFFCVGYNGQDPHLSLFSILASNALQYQAGKVIEKPDFVCRTVWCFSMSGP